MSNDFILEYTLSNTNLNVTLPLNGIVNVIVYWDNSTPETFTTTGNKTHTYLTPGTYTVRITGTTLEHFGSLGYPNSENLRKVISFGNLNTTSLAYAFYNATNLTQVPTTLPSTITNLSYTFYNASSFNQSLNTWNVINITTMSNMFNGASSFNQSINNWKTNNVINMQSMFKNATAFNQDISYKVSDLSWNVLKVTNMNSMFQNASNFNQPIINWATTNVIDMGHMFDGAIAFSQNIKFWNVSKVTNMEYMFASTPFTYSLNLWNTSTVLNMQYMFYNASIFNGLITNWNVSQVSNMSHMFDGAKLFNQNISTWNTSNVENMSYMFKNAEIFNQSITTWNTSNVTNMSGMFKNAYFFNQAIKYSSTYNYWDTSNVTDMSYMFQNISYFNQPIGNWNVSNVQNMQSMFENTISFNRDISTWDISSVTNLIDFYKNLTMSQSKYDQLLKSWNLLTLQPNVIFNAGNSIYSYGAPASAKQTIINTDNWTIIDGGIEPTPPGNPMILEFQVGVDKTITLPLSQTVNITVYWGDESIDSYNTAGNKNHTYTNSGTYIVQIYGTLDQYGIQSYPNADKITRVLNWGNIGLSDLSYAFYNATNLIEIPDNLPALIVHLDFAFYGATSFNDPNIISWDTSHIVRMESMFAYASSFNQPIGNWNVSNVDTMNSMFSYATSFDQPLGDWNIINVLDMTNFMIGCNLDINNYDDLLVKWSYLSLNYNINFHAGSSIYSYDEVTNRKNYIINTFNWTITDGGNRPLITQPLTIQYKTLIGDKTISLPLFGNVDVDVDWGDGKFVSVYTSGVISHTYDVPGIFTVKIYNSLEQFGNGVEGYTNANKVFKVIDFGNINITSLSGAFNNAINLIQVPTTIPSTLTDISYLFFEATKFNDPNIISWNVQNIIDISYIFFNAKKFNQPLDNWNTSNHTANITRFTYFLFGAIAYNQTLAQWIIDKMYH
jgi:surface protein